MDWRNTVCQSVGIERITDISNYVEAVGISSLSPLDKFYSETQGITSLATPATLSSNSWIGPLFAVGIVSSTENYFRDILGKIIKICPICQSQSADNPIKLGSVVWHSQDEIERGAFEHLSFASAETIKSTFKKYLNIDLKKSGHEPIVEEFDKICELRHGIVHSCGIMAGKNGIKLQISRTNQTLKIKIDYAQLQKISAVCTTLVVSINIMLFEALCRRWAIEWRRQSSWDPANETKLFKTIWKMFRSEKDDANGTIPENYSWIRSKNLIKKEFNI